MAAFVAALVFGSLVFERKVDRKSQPGLVHDLVRTLLIFAAILGWRLGVRQLYGGACIASHRVASGRIGSHRVASGRIASHRVA